MDYVIGGLVVAVVGLIVVHRQQRAQLLAWGERYARLEATVEALVNGHDSDECHSAFVAEGLSDRMENPRNAPHNRKVVEEFRHRFWGTGH